MCRVQGRAQITRLSGVQKQDARREVNSSEQGAALLGMPEQRPLHEVLQICKTLRLERLQCNTPQTSPYEQKYFSQQRKPG